MGKLITYPEAKLEICAAGWTGAEFWLASYAQE